MRPFLACLLTVLFVACGPPSSTASPTSKKKAPGRSWTVMYYVDSDNDLEGTQLEDLVEIMKAGNTRDVQVLVLVDRSAKKLEEDGYSDAPVANLPNFTASRLLVAKDGEYATLEEWGELDMARPEAVERLVETGKRLYPADKYALVFLDHGSGWTGLCTDDTSKEEGDELTMPELKGALEGADLELIGFDCCLMATTEVALELRDTGRYLVASQELEPLQGWAHTRVLKALQDRPEMDGAELGKVVLETYPGSMLGSDDPDDKGRALAMTMSVVDLSKMAPVAQALEALGKTLHEQLEKNGRQAWLEAARARSLAEEYGSFSTDEDPEDALHDLTDLADHLARLAPAETKALKEALKGAVLFTYKGKARPQANGLSIFFPMDENEWNDDYQTVSGPNWLAFLDLYTELASQDDTPPGLAEVESASQTLETGGSLALESEVEGDDVDQCYFVLAEKLEDVQVLIGSIPIDEGEAGKLARDWDGKWYAVGDAEGFINVAVTEFEKEEDGSLWVGVPAQWQARKGGRWRDVILYLYFERGGEGEVVYAMLDEEGQDAREIELEEGNRLRAMFLEVDEDGEEEYVVDEDPDRYLLVDDEGLQVDMLEVDPGTYSVGFMARDLAGNFVEKMKEVVIE